MSGDEVCRRLGCEQFPSESVYIAFGGLGMYYICLSIIYLFVLILHLLGKGGRRDVGANLCLSVKVWRIQLRFWT